MAPPPFSFFFLSLYKCLFFRSKKINSLSDTSSTTTSSSSSSTTITFAQHQQSQYHPHSTSTSAAANQLKSPRKSWSSIAYNNKNFPDKKLGYEQHSITTNIGNNANNKYFSKGYNKFERSGQDVMARASQIVQ